MTGVGWNPMHQNADFGGGVWHLVYHIGRFLLGDRCSFLGANLYLGGFFIYFLGIARYSTWEMVEESGESDEHIFEWKHAGKHFGFGKRSNDTV